MAEDKRTRDLDDNDSILIIKTKVDLLLLSLNQSKRHFLKMIDFKGEGLPTEMGAMRLGNDRFFLFGGRKTVGESWLDGYGKLVKSVYKLVHDHDDWSLELTEEVKEPDTPKILPWVEEVNGNIFVLQKFHWFRFAEECPHIFLEAYDKTFKTWNQIPTQNSWKEEEEAIIKSGSISASFSVGCRIYIVMKNQEKSQCSFCFNTMTSEWEKESASNLWNSFNNCPVNLPFNAVCVSRIANLEVNLNVILYKEYNTMLAYLIDNSGSLVCYQDISCELYKNREKISHCFGESLINHKSGGGRMCLVTKFPSVGENEEEWVILIRDFELKVKQGLEEAFQELSAYGASPMNKELEFLTVHIYGNQCVNINDPHGANFGLRDAFFL